MYLALLGTLGKGEVLAGTSWERNTNLRVLQNLLHLLGKCCSKIHTFSLTNSAQRSNEGDFLCEKQYFHGGAGGGRDVDVERKRGMYTTRAQGVFVMKW